jgi:hypothetical protein
MGIQEGVGSGGVEAGRERHVTRLDGSHEEPAERDLTLVTLECTPVDIAMSVVEPGSAVYSPAVLRLRDQT